MQNNSELSIKNLSEVNHFRVWIKDNLPKLYVNSEIPLEHLLIYTEYIKTKVTEDSKLDQVFWFKAIRELESKIKSLTRTE